ncbi:response regulator [Rhabdochromatium marinum]|uniref:response regulator n=1 Tax=Rhabdochromatium marinum TaxID=48729 RepID=UPI001903DC0B|nr:response regulator [Rhabdochromatium marinum]MBK1649107.1 multifunctional response regulator receiver/nitrate/sulfonate/bicarbonate ABC transporter substrate-binding protein [Rhabdochromatium marinum]
MSIKILAVDDSGVMRSMAVKFLKQAGYDDVVTAKDGLDAIEKLQEHIFDLIISDWNMPRLDGLELLRWIREDSGYQDIPFIMATAQGDKSQTEIIYKEGGAHITKPYSADELKQKILDVFEGTSETDQPIERKIVDGKVVIRAVHIQITDHLALGVLKHQIDSGQIAPKHFSLETFCKPGWNPVQQMIESGQADIAFILAPLAMDLFAFDVPIKMVSLAHKCGSCFVRNINYKTVGYESLYRFYKWKEIIIPHKMSIHHLLAHKFLTELKLKPGLPEKNAPINVRFEVMPPIKMPETLQQDYIAGYIVAEPLGSKGIKMGLAELQSLSGDMWSNHPCCAVVMRQDFIDEHPEAAQEFVSLLNQAGQFIHHHHHEAANIAVPFLDPQQSLGLTSEVIQKVLEQPNGIQYNDLYPSVEELDAIQQYMHYQMNIGRLINVKDFIDFRFIDKAMEEIAAASQSQEPPA